LRREKRVCGKPFQHCCIGQGRQLGTRHQNISQLYVKWSEPTDTLATLLDYMSQRDIPCNLWFMGMSLSGDQTIGALCELQRDHGYELDPVDCVPYGNERWNEKEALNCSTSTPGRPVTSQYYRLTNEDRDACPTVTLAHSGHFDLDGGAANPYSRRGGLVVANYGAHCKTPGCVAAKLAASFTPARIEAMEGQGWHFVWRETERKHFATPNGYYRKNVSHKECRPLATVDGDYLNREAEDFWRNLTLATNKTIPIVPLAEATEPLHFMHGYDLEKSIYDCTHYVYSPWRFHLTWGGIVRGLKSVAPLPF
jgi:hypothetical protein